MFTKGGIGEDTPNGSKNLKVGDKIASVQTPVERREPTAEVIDIDGAGGITFVWLPGNTESRESKPIRANWPHYWVAVIDRSEEI